ncbi:MAG TPA: DUF1232 domain-containing protein [Dehalococcoidia bacterium]|jgi:uncharacterized membrane protein YkvA (DUF1232 family)|nr:DUF1232 domain-containing protein [Dehalococcoidia bacterium]
MEWWQILLIVFVAVALLIAVAAYVLIKKASSRTKALAARVQKLSWPARLRLVAALMRDERIPRAVRLIPPLLVLYLAMPIDIVPDFIPVLGQLDDVLVAIVAIGLIVKFAPVNVIESHITALEAEDERSRPPARLP